jgi:hypothetical protein
MVLPAVSVWFYVDVCVSLWLLVLFLFALSLCMVMISAFCFGSILLFVIGSEPS